MVKKNHFEISTTAYAEMPSSRPVKPNFSVVVALMEMSSVSIPITSANTCCICGIWFFNFGRSAHTVASIFPIVYPFVAIRATVFFNKILLSMFSNSPAVSQQAHRMLNLYPAQPKVSPLYQTVDIKSESCTYLHRMLKSSTFLSSKYPSK